MIPITMLATAAGPGGVYPAGQTLEVGVEISKDLAQAFVAGGYARPEKKNVAKSQPSGLAVETAMVEPVAEKHGKKKG